MMSMHIAALIHRGFTFALGIVVLSLGLSPNVMAGETILTVSLQGSVAAEQEFTREDLEMLGLSTVVTDTPWTSGDVTFEGVLVSEILSGLGVDGGTLRAAALNDYAVDLPIAELLEYNVIVALKRDGQYLTIRDRGPLWVIYPWKDNPNLRTELHYSRAIWQLKRLDVTPE